MNVSCGCCWCRHDGGGDDDDDGDDDGGGDDDDGDDAARGERPGPERSRPVVAGGPAAGGALAARVA